jgi:hypothetical protein
MKSPTAGLAAGLVLLSFAANDARGDEDASRIFQTAAENGRQADEIFTRTRRLAHAWLKHADPRTLLLPDSVPGCPREAGERANLYTPHNSGADNYPYLVAAAWFTDRALYEGRLREMLRNEVRFTAVKDGVPGNLLLKEGKLGPPSLFGAAEYAKDGLIAITELLGRTPWYYRMVDMTAAVMNQAAVTTRFGNLPDPGAEVNGDLLQVLVRLAAMTGDRRFQAWAERIADAYLEEVLPNNFGLPTYAYDFEKRRGEDRLRLRDHGNEIVVGLVLLHALESSQQSPRAARSRPILARMLDRILASANPDGMLYDEIRCSDLEPLTQHLSDNWGYVYGAVYTFYMITGEERYRQAVQKVLKDLPKYRNHDWENGSQDGYADSIESALYLVNREPTPEAWDWIETEIRTLIGFQKPSGLVECWHGDGNWARTLLLYAMYKTQGCYLEEWREGVRLGAMRSGERLFVSLEAPSDWQGLLRFDFARHRRVLNFDRNYVRLNEWPEWFTVDENRLYRITNLGGEGRLLLGSDLKDGVPVGGTGRWVVEPSSTAGGVSHGRHNGGYGSGGRDVRDAAPPAMPSKKRQSEP